MATLKLTMATARALLSPRGITLRHRDGEYTVNYVGSGSSSAYYTNDLQDAVDTGMAMADAKGVVEAVSAPAKTETIDCTPTWEAVLPILLMVYRDSETTEGRNTARAELVRMAKLADAFVAGNNSKAGAK